MQLEEYNWAMNEMLKDKEFIYSSMIKTFIFWAWCWPASTGTCASPTPSFMFGLIMSVLAFAVAVLVYGS
jgi:hypothetical protein